MRLIDYKFDIAEIWEEKINRHMGWDVLWELNGCGENIFNLLDSYYNPWRNFRI